MTLGHVNLFRLVIRSQELRNYQGYPPKKKGQLSHKKNASYPQNIFKPC
jgi:hypothetical protein